MTTHLRGALVALLILTALVLALVPATAEPGDPGHPESPQVALVYETDIDGPVAVALARASTLDGIETIAYRAGSNSGLSGEDFAGIECYVSVGPRTHPFPERSYGGPVFLTAQGQDRWETAEIAAEKVHACENLVR